MTRDIPESCPKIWCSIDNSNNPAVARSVHTTIRNLNAKFSGKRKILHTVSKVVCIYVLRLTSAVRTRLIPTSAQSQLDAFFMINKHKHLLCDGSYGTHNDGSVERPRVAPFVLIFVADYHPVVVVEYIEVRVFGGVLSHYPVIA